MKGIKIEFTDRDLDHIEAALLHSISSLQNSRDNIVRRMDPSESGTGAVLVSSNRQIGRFSEILENIWMARR